MHQPAAARKFQTGHFTGYNNSLLENNLLSQFLNKLSFEFFLTDTCGMKYCAENTVF